MWYLLQTQLFLLWFFIFPLTVYFYNMLLDMKATCSPSLLLCVRIWHHCFLSTLFACLQKSWQVFTTESRRHPVVIYLKWEMLYVQLTNCAGHQCHVYVQLALNEAGLLISCVLPLCSFVKSFCMTQTTNTVTVSYGKPSDHCHASRLTIAYSETSEYIVNCTCAKPTIPWLQVMLLHIQYNVLEPAGSAQACGYRMSPIHVS